MSGDAVWERGSELSLQAGDFAITFVRGLNLTIDANGSTILNLV